MFARYIASALVLTDFTLTYFVITQTIHADSFERVAEESRHLAEAGRWDQAKRVLEDELPATQDPVGVARLKAELAHYATDLNQPARDSFDQALDLTRKTGDERLQSFVGRNSNERQ